MGECASINAVLRACMPCDALPASRRWVLADRVSIDRARPGMQIDVRLGGVPARDSVGRIAHVRGLYVRCSGDFDIISNPAVSAYQLRSLFSALYMQDVTGTAYWPSIDARDILDDNWARHYGRVQGPYLATGTQGGARAPNAPTQTADYGLPLGPPGPYIVNLSWYAPLVTLGPGLNPFAGLIPLAALQQQSNMGSIRFRLMPSVAGAPAGVTFNGVINGEGNPGLDVWLDVVYLPVLAINPTWVLDNYELPETSSILRYEKDTTEHLHIRYRPEDGTWGGFSGHALVNNLDIFSLTTAGFVEMTGLSFDDAQLRMFLYQYSERDSALVRANAAQDLPIADSTTGEMQVMTLLPYRQRGQGAAAGALDFKVGTMGPNPFIRFLHRVTGCNEAAAAQEIVKAVNCDLGCKSVMTDGQGKVTSQGTTNGTLLVMDPKANGGKAA